MVNFGADVLGKLGPPLSLLLQSLRWSLYEISQLQDLEFRQTFDELAKGTSHKISLSLFLSNLSLVGASRESLSRIGELVCAELQQRWTSILQPPLGGHTVLVCQARSASCSAPARSGASSIQLFSSRESAATW